MDLKHNLQMGGIHKTLAPHKVDVRIETCQPLPFPSSLASIQPHAHIPKVRPTSVGQHLGPVPQRRCAWISVLHDLSSNFLDHRLPIRSPNGAPLSTRHLSPTNCPDPSHDSFPRERCRASTGSDATKLHAHHLIAQIRSL